MAQSAAKRARKFIPQCLCTVDSVSGFGRHSRDAQRVKSPDSWDRGHAKIRSALVAEQMAEAVTGACARVKRYQVRAELRPAASFAGAFAGDVESSTNVWADTESDAAAAKRTLRKFGICERVRGRIRIVAQVVAFLPCEGPSRVRRPTLAVPRSATMAAVQIH